MDIIEDYYKSLNTFESILLNRSTNYNATFEVIKDDISNSTKLKQW